MSVSAITATMPSLNEEACQNWSDKDRNMYWQLPYFMQEVQASYFQTWNSWSKVFSKSIPWKPNMGKTMKIITSEPSPHLRQIATPGLIWDTPTVDVITINEHIEEAFIYRKRFMSDVFDWEPQFVDYLQHINDTTEDMVKKQDRYNDIFLRSFAFFRSPNVYISCANSPLVLSPTAQGNEAGTAASSKNTAWLSARVMELGQPGNLLMTEINRLSQIMSGSLRVPAYSGSNKPVQNAGLDQKYVLKLSAEAWDQFVFDPWVLQNKAIDLNIVTDRFKGNLWGKIVCDIEDLPLRMLADGTFPAPETVEMNAASPEYGLTVLNPTYDTAPYEWAFMHGAESYKKVTIGPPPAPFSSGDIKMEWNGKVKVDKNIIVKCKDNAGNEYSELNARWGEKLQLISQLTCGAAPIRPRHMVPILFRRYRGAMPVAA